MASSAAWTSSTSRTAASRRAVLPLTSAAAFVAFLDVTVTNAAFPHLSRSFPGAELAELSWTVTAYGAVFAAVLIPAGRLADGLGHRRVLAGGIGLFVVASAACATATSSVELIAARAVQGVAAGLMTPASFGLLLRETTKGDRARAVSIWSAAAAVSALLGPSLGGLIVEAGGWRTAFGLNLPLGVALLVVLVRAVAARRPEGGALPDAIGTVLLTTGVALLVVGTTKAGDWGLLDARTLAVAGVGAGGTALALVRSGRRRAAVVDLDLLRGRSFAVATAVSLVFSFAVFSWLLAGPLFTSTVWHYDALAAALSVAPGALTATAASLCVGRLSARGRGWVILGGAVLFAATSVALVPALDDSPRFLSVWLPAGVLSGLAVGGVLAGLSATVAFSLPAERFAAGAGMNMTARQLGGSFGVAGLAALLGPGGSHTPADFTVVWLVGAAASLAAGAGALALLRRS
jgi:EmrB/QacA subfamily drug resistance transporter